MGKLQIAVIDTNADNKRLIDPQPNSSVENSISCNGISDLELAIKTDLGMPVVRQILKNLLEDGLVYYDDRAELWFREPQKRLQQLKQEIVDITQKIQLGFYEIGKRLKEIRDLKLYQAEGYIYFEEFVEKELNFKRDYAYKQIAATQVLEDIKPVYTIGIQTQIKERHLRPLTPETFTPDDRIKIWSEVEADLSNMKAETGKPARLTDRVVRKAVMQFQESQVKNPPELPPLQVGDYCRVRLQSSHLNTDLISWNNKVVKVLQVGNIKGVTCCGPFGEEIKDCFFREELQILDDTATQKFSVELSIDRLKQLQDCHCKNCRNLKFF